MGGLGLFLATLDTGIINIALPALQTAWHVGASEIAWTVAAYTLTLAGTVLFWGHLADGVGPERVFVVGLTV
ncbi:MAG: MFS transporter, partial [Thermaerobacter sp.]|nr:MFS transporter [Thermaerobacter sp.]